MKNNILLITIILLFILPFNLLGQNIYQKADVETESFPEISFEVNVYNPNIKLKKDFKIKENSKIKKFEVENITDFTDIDTSKAVLIIFEDLTHSVHAGQATFFKKVLKKSMPDFVNKNDKVNIAVFDRNRDGITPLRFLSNKYTDDYQNLLDKINSHKPKYDYQSNNKSSDLFNAIYDGMKDLKEKFPDKNKIIIVLSAGFNFETSNENTQESLINYSIKNKIPVYSMQYRIWENRTINRLASESFGKYYMSIKHKVDITADSTILFMNKAVFRQYGQDYKFTYDSDYKQDGELHTLVLEFENTKLDIQYKSPDCNIVCLTINNPIIAGGILLLLIVVAYFSFSYYKKTVKIKVEEQKKIQEKNKQDLQRQARKIQQVEQQNRSELNKLEENHRKEEEKRKREEKLKQEEDARAKQFKKQEQIELATILEMTHLGLPKLQIYNASESAEFIIDKPNMVAGRDKTCDIVINDKNISRKHFSISYKNNEYTITDNNSTNGLTINGYKAENSILKHNDIIVIGSITIKFVH